MIVFAIIVFKTTALNRSATGPENLWFPNKLCLFEKLRFPWCPPQRDEWGTPNKRSLFENLKIKDFELQGNFDCKKYVFYSENLPLWATTVRSHTLALIASACDRVTHSSRSHTLAVVRFPAGGTKGTSVPLVPTRLRSFKIFNFSVSFKKALSLNSAPNRRKGALMVFYFVPTTPSGTVTLFQLYHNHEFISWSFNVQHLNDTVN